MLLGVQTGAQKQWDFGNEHDGFLDLQDGKGHDLLRRGGGVKGDGDRIFDRRFFFDAASCVDGEDGEQEQRRGRRRGEGGAKTHGGGSSCALSLLRA
mmetsp:Transcript_13841/g.40501  ORF Transcript_13841/g.40501 Transcript_13841/m.40501 type:complete len:97 (+) Transcript_13841:631-921(+)